MAPSPENDNAPKAPDKGEPKVNAESSATVPECRTQDHLEISSAPENKEASVSRLDDVELKALLDEAINYKIPKDRVGKSKLFQNLLEKAEEDDRKARATSASGSESVRYYNTTATHRTRRRREPNSVSENLTHGGSLNNLAKEELYAAASHLHRPHKTVSARQRQGGSLPCNVNAGITPSYDKEFFEGERLKMENKKAEYTTIDMESESLLEHDSLSQEYGEQPEIEVVQTRIPRIPIKYTSRFKLEIEGGNNVDDSLSVAALDRSCDKEIEVAYKPVETIAAATPCPSARYSLLMPGPIWPFNNRKPVEDKKMDENGNALAQGISDSKKNKKKKIQTDKNVVVLAAKDVAGHRSDIINDLDKLVEYIGGNEEQTGGVKSKSNIHKAKLQKHHFSSSADEKGAPNGKKQRTRPKKPEKMQKSNSMEEISISKLDDFNFSPECDGNNKVALRGTKSNMDRPRERRSWGNSESLPLHASAENLADFRVVTKKKKSKKRRNSIGGRRQGRDLHESEFNRMPSPEPRRKSACSVPHSDKSNDSSDVDSVHSLPIDTDCLSSTNLNLPISYADIAKHTTLERPKWNRPPSERKTKSASTPLHYPETIELAEVVNRMEQPALEKIQQSVKVNTQSVQTSPKLQFSVENFCLLSPELEGKPTETTPLLSKPLPDVQSWPTILTNHNNYKTVTSCVLTNKNNHKSVLHKQNHPPPQNNIKNNLKTEKLIQQQFHYLPTNNPNSVHSMEAAVQILHGATEQICINNVQVLPRNIPDVQTIEKMHFKQLQQAMHNHNNPIYLPHGVHDLISNHVTHLPPQTIPTAYVVPSFVHQEQRRPANNNNNNIGCLSMMDEVVVQQTAPTQLNNCDSDRTSSRPAVVILSGDNNREVSGITFGFDINEQLLSDDVCDNFTARFYVPDVFHSHNHDKIVNFIGLAWEDTVNQSNGKVKYFSEQL